MTLEFSLLVIHLQTSVYYMNLALEFPTINKKVETGGMYYTKYHRCVEILSVGWGGESCNYLTNCDIMTNEVLIVLQHAHFKPSFL